MEPTSTEILVLGAGPGGYTAAFYAADKGKKVTLVEQNPRLGGVCTDQSTPKSPYGRFSDAEGPSRAERTFVPGGHRVR